jgi:SAM-dependent methyltransferase
MTDSQLALIAGMENARILDVGAGTGRLSVEFAARGHRVTAVEPSRDMLAELRRKAEDAMVFAQIDCVSAPIQDCVGLAADHDAAFCVFSTIHHLVSESELVRGMSAIAAALRKRGRLFIGVHPPSMIEGFRDGPERMVLLNRHNVRVGWRQYVEAVDGQPGLFETFSVVRLQDGTVRRGQFRTRTWSEVDIEAAAKCSGLQAVPGRQRRIGTETVLVFEKA